MAQDEHAKPSPRTLLSVLVSRFSSIESACLACSTLLADCRSFTCCFRCLFAVVSSWSNPSVVLVVLLVNLHVHGTAICFVTLPIALLHQAVALLHQAVECITHLSRQPTSKTKHHSGNQTTFWQPAIFWQPLKWVTTPNVNQFTLDHYSKGN